MAKNQYQSALDDAVKAVEQQYQAWKKVDEQILSISKNAREAYGKAIPETPRGVSEHLNKNKVLNEQINAAYREQQRLEKALISQIAKKDAVLESTNIALQKQRYETSLLNKLATETAILESKLTSEYKKASIELTKMQNEYKNLAIQKELGKKLTVEETATMDRLEKEAVKVSDALKKVDATMGQYGRNVGNYKSGFDGLGFSIAQLSREAPAFAVSMQTGFLAISNNIPMLVDEINKIKIANKALASEGKQTQSVLGSVGKALFGWQTLVSVGVTLMTLYGAELVELSKGLFTASDSASLMAENTKKINEEASNILGSTVPKFKALVSISQDLTKTEKERLDAINEITKSYPDFNAEILKEKDNTELVNIEVSTYIGILDKKAKAQAAMSVVQEKYSKLIIKEQEAQKTLLEQGFENEEQFRKLDKERNERNQRTSAEEARRFTIARNALKGLKEEREEINDILNVYIDNVDLANKADDKDDKKKLDYRKGSLKFFEAQISALQQLQENTAKNGKEWDKIQEKIFEARDALQDFKDLLEGEGLSDFDTDVQAILKGDLSSLEGFYNETKETFEDIDKIYKQDVQNFKDAQKEKAKIEKDAQKKKEDAQKLYDRERLRQTNELYRNIEDFARASIDSIFEVQEQKYDDQIESNNDYYDRLLENERLSDRQRETLEKEREEKNKQLEKKKEESQRKAFLLQQAISLAQVIMDTAKGVTTYLSNPVTAPLVPLVIANGALQAATITATAIPAFEEGHLEGSYEGQALINDAKSATYREIVQRKDGSLEMYSGRNTVIDMQKGDKVHSAGTFTVDDAIRNMLATTFTHQAQQLDRTQARQASNIDERIEKAIKKGFSGVVMNNNSSFDTRQLAKEIAMNKRSNI